MSKKNSTTTSKVSIPPEVLARYNAVNTRAEGVANTPFERYGNAPEDFVAQMNAQQNAGINDINATAGSYKPYLDAAGAATTAGMGPAYEGIDNYMSPYIRNVADTTGAMLRQQYEQSQSGNLGNAISSGAFGGDRAGIAAANLQQQNSMAYGKTMADIYNQGYTQALGASQQDLARQMAGGAQLAQLGSQSQQLGLQGAQAKMAAGTMQQQTEQAGKDAMIKQFMQEKGYPFQVAQFLANIAMGTGANSGSTTSTTQPVGFFGNLFKDGGKVDGYADGGGVSGPMTISQSPMWEEGYVPAAGLPVGKLMVAEPPQGNSRDQKAQQAFQMAMQIASLKNGGVAGGRHGYDTGGSPGSLSGYPYWLQNAVRNANLARDAAYGTHTAGPPIPMPPSAPAEPSQPLDPMGNATSLPVGSDLDLGSPANRAGVGSAVSAKDTAPTGLVPAPLKEEPKSYFIDGQTWIKNPNGTVTDFLGNTIDVEAAGGINQQIKLQDKAEMDSKLAQSYDTLAQTHRDKLALAERNKNALLGMYQGEFPVSAQAESLASKTATPGGVIQPMAATGAMGYTLPTGLTAISGAPPGGLSYTLPTGLGTPANSLAPTSSPRPMPRPADLGTPASASGITKVSGAPVATGIVTPSATAETTAGPVVTPAATGVATPDAMAAASSAQGGIYTGVAKSGPGWVDLTRPDGTVEHRVGAANWRNNNPGNVEYGEFAKSHGAIGTDGRFAVFPDAETGLNASKDLLFNSDGYRGMTIAQALSRYSPPSENPTGAKIAAITSAVGLPADTPMDRLSPQQRDAFMLALQKTEGPMKGDIGASSPYTTSPVSGLGGANINTQAGTMGGGLGAGDLLHINKPYEQRNAIGQFFHNKDTGKLEKNSVLSLLSGLGAMANSNSISPFTAILQGLAGGANTYKELEKQASDIALQGAQTRETDIRTDVSRFFSAIPGTDGFPLVIIGPGKAVTLTEYLKNPVAFSTGDPNRDAAIRQEAQRISSGSGAPAGTPASGASAGVRWTPASDAAIAAAKEKLVNRPGDFSSNDRASRDVMAAAAQERTTALQNKPNSNELALTVGSAIADNNMGTAEGYLSGTVLPMVNAALRTLNPEFVISDADSQAKVLEKLSMLNGAAMTPEQQRAASVYQSFVDVSPDMKMTPEAGAIITSGIMSQNQDAIDRANYYSYFMSKAGSGVSIADVDAAYAQEYAEMHQMEKEGLKQLFLMAQDEQKGPTVKKFLEEMNAGTASQEDAQAVLQYLLGENTPPLLVRYFIKGM